MRTPTNYLNIEKFTETAHQSDPFEYVIVPQILDSKHLDEVNADFPEIEKAGNFPIDGLSYGPHFKAFIDEIKSPAFREAIEATAASKQYRPMTLKRKVKQWLGLEA